MSGDSVYKVGPGVRISGDDAILDARNIQSVWLWDIGPEQPTPPEQPRPPARKDTAEDVNYKLAAEAYETARRQYDVDLTSFHQWNRHYGGPYMERMWSHNADTALKADLAHVEGKWPNGELCEITQTRRRWYIASRTRGYRNLPNQGLPEGFSPGRWHQQMLVREAAGEADYAAARRADPVFGMEMGQ
jgi:hypothetical protein